MPHISKRKIGKEHFDRLIQELIRAIDRSSNNGETKSFIFEFLTYTERAMLAKRLGVIAMLSRGISPFAISDAMNMSPATISRMKLKYDLGKYSSITKQALGKKDMWGIIDSILTVGGIMPPVAGGKRWKRIDRAIYKRKLKET